MLETRKYFWAKIDNAGWVKPVLSGLDPDPTQEGNTGNTQNQQNLFIVIHVTSN